MVFALRIHERFVRVFGAVKSAKVNIFAVNLNLGLPLAGAESPRAHKTGLAVRPNLSLVAGIIARGYVPKIRQPIVVSDAVDVVNIGGGPAAINVKPSKPVFAVLPALYADVAVSLGDRLKSCASASLRKLVSGDAVCENARIGVIMQNLFKHCLRQCNLGFSHFIAPSKQWFGQRITVAANFGNPRNIIQGIV